MIRNSFRFSLVELIKEQSIDGNLIPTNLKEMQTLFGILGEEGYNHAFYKFNNWQCHLDKDKAIKYISLQSISDWNRIDQVMLSDSYEFLHDISEERLMDFLKQGPFIWEQIPLTDDLQATIEINSFIQVVICREKDGIENIIIYNNLPKKT